MTELFRGNRLDVVLKLAERCNLACPYCYYFEQENNISELSRALIPEQTVIDTARFLRQGAQEMGIKNIFLGLHGGEPTLLPKKRFDRMCTIFREELADYTQLHIGMQTNGTLVDAEWIDLFAKHNVMVGVSIDGPKDVHDRQRPDRRGRGSYDNSVRGLKLLQQAAKERRIPATGVLCVANPDLHGGDVIRHFVEELDVHSLNLLLPREGHNNTYLQSQDKWIRYFNEVIDYWLQTRGSNPVRIYLLTEIVLALMSEEYAEGLDYQRANRHGIVTVSAEGFLGPDDNIMALDKAFCLTDVTVRNTTLAQFFGSPIWQTLVKSIDTPPTKCASCDWYRTCRSGDLFNRYAPGTHFDQASVFCETLDSIHTAMASIVSQREGALETMAGILATAPRHAARDFLNPVATA